MELPERYKATGNEAWGNKVRFGFSPISDNEVYWFAVARSKPGRYDSIADLHSRLTEMFKYFHPLVTDMIENTPVEKILRNDINDLKRLERWSDGKVCLLGDAAHATTPNMGQGACQGIEDAYYIAQSLSNCSRYSEAFLQFEESRRKKVDYIVNTSWRFGKMAHNSIGQPILKFLMKHIPEKTLFRQMKYLYSVKDL